MVDQVRMFKMNLQKFILLSLVILMGGVLIWWLLHDPVASFAPSLPGMDNRKAGASVPSEIVHIGEDFTFFKTCDGIPGTLWPRFRGEGYDNINRENIRLVDRFGKEGPRILWKIPLGEGHAAPAVFDGRVYLLDYDETRKADLLRCFSLKSGEELWRRGYHVHLKRNHGLSRTIPAVSEKYVVTIGPKCQVMCVDRLTGDLLWGIDLAKEFGTEVPFWYTGQCPLVDKDTAILAVGGTSLLVAVDCRTGKKVWETPNPHHWKMSHSSIMPMNFDGKKMYVYFAVGGICGVSATGSDRGQIVWENQAFAPSVIAPSPVILGDGKIFMTAGYGAGATLIQLTGATGRFSVRVLQQYKPQEGLASEQQTPVAFDGFIYGILPKDAGGLRNQFVACRTDDCKKFVMNSGKTQRFGMGPFILADGKFFILNDDGELTIARVSASKFTVLDQVRIIDGQDSWGPLAVTGGYLLMRDSKQMVCLDIREK